VRLLSLAIIVLCAVMAFPSISLAQSAPTAENYLNCAPQDLEWWREARFGLFIHWSPVCIVGTEIGWSRRGKRLGRSGTGKVPIEVYDNLYQMFDPQEYDADEWVAVAKAAGMKYVVLTTKHHDGFCMFDTKTTDYNIMNTPFKRDIVREFVDACNRADMKFGFYYSQPDWWHADYRSDNHDRYIKYFYEHVREILTNYGKIDIMWFDGLGAKAEIWDAPNLLKLVRTLQPGIIINSRTGLAGDFSTPEQRVGHFRNQRPWESCMTFNRQWAYKPYEPVRPLKECVDMLVGCAGGDGNMLLNVGPMPSGKFDPRHVSRLREIGKWMEHYGESIYGTRGGPFLPGNYGASTRKGNKIYLHLLEQQNSKGIVQLPSIGCKIKKAYCMTGGKMKLSQSEDRVVLDLDSKRWNDLDTIVVLELESSAMDIKTLKVAEPVSLTTGKAATTSNCYRNIEKYNAAKAFDGDNRTRWSTDVVTEKAWLEVDLGEPMTFSRAVVNEAYGGRIELFKLEVLQDGKWKAFAEGDHIGGRLVETFKPVTARRVRLNIIKVGKCPTIYEFNLYNMDD
jgi:alpha-L-fucosidase